MKILIFIFFLTFINTYSQKTIEEIQKVLASDSEAEDRFGSSVSISGNYAIIGVPFEDTGGSNAGAAYFFELVNGTWTFVNKVIASDAETDDNFGTSVSISGLSAVIGAPKEDSNGLDAGAAYFFELTNGTWSEVIKVTASDAQAGDWFGNSVSIDGINTIIGARFEDSIGSDAGAAYFFELTNGTWNEVNKVTASDAQAGDDFGVAVSISGMNAVIGAFNEDSEASDAGAAYFFKLSNGTWSEVNKVTASDAEAIDWFGVVVSLSGTNAIIGAYHEDEGGSSAGAAYFFELSNGIWSEVNKVIASDAEAGDRFGNSVSISGTNAVIGANAEESGGSDAGAAYFYELSNGTWSEYNKVITSDAEDGDDFGISVSISNRLVVVGARFEDTGGNNAGAAYFFEINSPPILSSFNAYASNNLIGELSANINDEGESTTLTFKYGTSSGNYTEQTNEILLSGDGIQSTESIQISNLIQNQTYFVIAEATNADGTTQSNEIQFTALININDSDGDGIEDSIENNAPNNGDGNGDGIQDNLQRSIVTLRDAYGNSFITISSQDNYDLNEVEASFPEDNMFSYPFGKTEFKINSSQAEVKIYYHGIASLDGYTYRKLLPNDTYGQFDNVTFSTEIINGNEVAVATLNLVDGGAGDYDGVVNGVIYDPGGPSLPVSANIPFWDWWYALILIPFLVYSYKRFS